MKFLFANEFKTLSDGEKEEYYDLLREEKMAAVTAELKQMVLDAYLEIVPYADSEIIASELKASLERQRIADAKYASEKRKKGVAAILCVAAVAVIAVIAAVIISML